MNDISGFWRLRALPIVLLLAAAILPYLHTLHGPFILDDTLTIVDNPVIRDLGRFLGGEGLSHNPRRFVGYLSFALNYHFGGLETFGYHLVNLAVHALATLLVYALVLLLFRTPHLADSRLAPHAPVVALAVALLFAVHPIQTQAVTYIVQRFTSLAALFYLLALVLYVRGRLLQTRDSGLGTRDSELRTESERAVAGHGSRITIFCLVGVVLAALLAMLTKEHAFTLPAMILLLELSFFPPGKRRRTLLLAGLAGAVLLAVAALYSSGRPLDDLIRFQEAPHITRGEYLLTQIPVLVTYLRLLILPINQNLDYDHPFYSSFATPAVFLAFFLLVALVGLAARLYWNTRDPGLETRDSACRQGEGVAVAGPGSRVTGHDLRLIAFGIYWFFIALSIESSFIPIADPLVEHRLYLPSVGIALAVVTALALLLHHRPARYGLALLAVAVLLLGIATVRRNQVWSGPLIMWADVVRKAPQNERGWTNLGMAQVERGEFEAGVRALQRGVQENPRYAKAHLNLGVAYAQLGRWQEAATAEEAALAIDPQQWQVHANLGTIYGNLGRFDEAVAHMDSALRLNPGARAQLLALREQLLARRRSAQP